MTIEKRKVLGDEMRKRSKDGQCAWITKEKLLFVKPDDGFVYNQTCMPPYYYTTEPRKRFKARPWTNKRLATSTPNNEHASGYSGTTYTFFFLFMKKR